VYPHSTHTSKRRCPARFLPCKECSHEDEQTEPLPDTLTAAHRRGGRPRAASPSEVEEWPPCEDVRAKVWGRYKQGAHLEDGFHPAACFEAFNLSPGPLSARLGKPRRSQKIGTMWCEDRKSREPDERGAHRERFTSWSMSRSLSFASTRSLPGKSCPNFVNHGVFTSTVPMSLGAEQ
jgi:hypothetical protein